MAGHSPGGSKVWELLPAVCTKNLGRIGLGHGGSVEGFADFGEVLCVGARVGNAFTAPPENPQHFCLAPHNLEKHRCTQRMLPLRFVLAAWLYPEKAPFIWAHEMNL